MDEKMTAHDTIKALREALDFSTYLEELISNYRGDVELSSVATVQERACYHLCRLQFMGVKLNDEALRSVILSQKTTSDATAKVFVMHIVTETSRVLNRLALEDSEVMDVNKELPCDYCSDPMGDEEGFIHQKCSDKAANDHCDHKPDANGICVYCTEDCGEDTPDDDYW